MKKAIFLLGVLISFYGLGQTQYAPLGSPFGNTINRINAQYGFQLPRGTDTSLKGSLDTVGMLFYKTTDTSLWLRVPKVSGVGNMWKKLNFSAGTIGNTIYTGNGSLSGDRTVNGGTNILTFNNLLRYYLQTSGDINISTTNSSNSNIGLNSAQSVSIYSANGNINNTSNGNITNDASGGHRFLSSGIFAPSLTNAISDKRLMYNSSTGEFTYADTTVGGGGTNYWDLTGTDIANNNSGNVTIGQNSTSRLTVDSTGSLNWYSNDPYFNLDGANRRFQIGDYTYDWYGTRIDVNDDFAARYIKNYAQNFYVIGDSVYTNGLMSAKDRNGIIEMGDINNDVNSTNLTLNDSAQSIIYKANNGHYFSTGQIFAPSISNAVSDKQLMYNSSTGEFAYADTIQINNLLKTKVDTSIRVIAGIDLIGGGSLSSNITLNADTSTGASKLATQGFVTRNSTGGTVTTLTKTNGIGTSITITNPTTTPNIKVDVDTIVVSTKANVTKDSAVLATAINGKIDSIRLVNTGVIFTTPAAYSKAGTTGVITQTLANQTAYKVLWNNTSGSAAPAFNYLDSNAFNNQFAIQVKAAQTPSNNIYSRSWNYFNKWSIWLRYY
jgi:hypothetical protein